MWTSFGDMICHIVLRGASASILVCFTCILSLSFLWCGPYGAVRMTLALMGDLRTHIKNFSSEFMSNCCLLYFIFVPYTHTHKCLSLLLHLYASIYPGT